MGAFGLPALLVMAVGAIELQQVWSDKHQTQDVADAAALMGSQQLVVAPVGATDRAKAYAEAQLANLMARSDVTVTATEVTPRTMKVAVDTHRMSFFANLLPPGGFQTHSEATAKGEAMAPLCVLSLNSSATNSGTGGTPKQVDMTSTSHLQAACMVHSNLNISVASGAGMNAMAIESVGSTSGAMTPVANTGAPPLDDPFKDIDLSFPAVCNVGDVLSLVTGSATLQPGLHCGNVSVGTGATLILAAGEHYFTGDLKVGDTSQLDGSAGVALVFASGKQILTSATAVQNLNLKGRTSGKLAGFVLATARDYTNDFSLPADHLSQITGSVYLPSARLQVNGAATAAGQTSPWTVVVAQGMTVNSSTSLVINAKYDQSDVPLPNGVGTKAGRTRLSR